MATLSAVMLSGCATQSETAATTTNTVSTTQRESATPTETETTETYEVYAADEWASSGWFAYNPMSVAVFDAIPVTGTARHLPDGYQEGDQVPAPSESLFALVEVRAENISDTVQSPPRQPVIFGITAGEELSWQAVSELEIPTKDGTAREEVSPGWLLPDSGGTNLASYPYGGPPRVDPGERVDAWFLSLIASSTEIDTLRPAMGKDLNGTVSFPVRWEGVPVQESAPFADV
ncbi:hypothetical protein [Halobellus ruber]|uniref:Uncharacterized protein n=1 Tax=Halobellus ruber TaxID=2761102 RepID=A0A7J9SMP0_9EURY|nr:hypothetical protein [Halobellus ruber]MBB6647988.1 hypothetical protein [Halobellus ruber]